MSDRVDLIMRLFGAYQQGDHAAMADFYHEQATFQDIAFELKNKQEISAMLHLICNNGIDIVIDEPPQLVGDVVTAKITATYMLSSTGREVVNPIRCEFRFRDGLIIEQRDECDPVAWAKQAVGGLSGWMAGQFGFLRRRVARKTLEEFMSKQQASGSTVA